MANRSTENALKPPAHLSTEMKRFWTWCCSCWAMEKLDLARLRVACESFDAAEVARKIVDREGPVYHDSRGNPRPHPCVAIQKSSHELFLKALRETGLDAEAVAAAPRMPRDKSYAVSQRYS